MRVLIAEDEFILAYVLRSQLEDRGMKVVALASTGKAAIERCLETRPDVVLMDVGMPDLDGIEATRAIMHRCPTCVIITTAHADEGIVAQARAAGAMGFLPKPVQAISVAEEIPGAQVRFAEFLRIHAEALDFDQAVATQRLVEKAKARLVADGEADAATAFDVLVERAAKSGLPLKAVAESLAALGEPQDHAEPGGV